MLDKKGLGMFGKVWALFDGVQLIGFSALIVPVPYQLSGSSLPVEYQFPYQFPASSLPVGSQFLLSSMEVGTVFQSLIVKRQT